MQADAEALVKTVNGVGFMGKGIALLFNKVHPANFDAYRKACEDEDSLWNPRNMSAGWIWECG